MFPQQQKSIVLFNQISKSPKCVPTKLRSLTNQLSFPTRDIISEPHPRSYMVER